MATSNVSSSEADPDPSNASSMEAKLRSEIRLNSAEAVLKKIEARRLLAKPVWLELSVPGATIIVALVGLFGTFLANYVKGWYDLELTRSKYDSDLVLKAVVPDANQTRENIKFLIQAGLIEDRSGKLANAVANPRLTIRLASQASADIHQPFSANQMKTLVDEIKSATGLQDEIGLAVVRGTPNAYVQQLRNGKFVLYYTQDFIDNTRRTSRSNWAAYTIVAHEIGHVALRHFNGSALENREKTELEADAWAGAALAKLGATKEDASAAYSSWKDLYKDTVIDLPMQERIKAVERGWESSSPSK